MADLRGGDLWRLVARAPRLLTAHVELAPLAAEAAEATFAQELRDAEAATPAAPVALRAFRFAAPAGLVLQALQRLALPAPQLETLELVALGPGDAGAAAGAGDLLSLLQLLLRRSTRVASVVVRAELGAADDAAPPGVGVGVGGGATPPAAAEELVACRLRTFDVSLTHFAPPDRETVARLRDAVVRAAPRLRTCAIHLPGEGPPL